MEYFKFFINALSQFKEDKTVNDSKALKRLEALFDDGSFTEIDAPPAKYIRTVAELQRRTRKRNSFFKQIDESSITCTWIRF